MEDLSYIWSVRQTFESCESPVRNSKARVRVEDELTECFEVRQGVKQGSPLSPWLFKCLLGHGGPRSKGSV